MSEGIDAGRRSRRKVGSWRALRARAWAFYFAHRPAIVLGMGLCLVAVHVLALHLLLAYSPWPGIAAAELGLTSRWVEFDRYHQNRVGLLARHAQALAPGAALFVGDRLLAALDAGALADHAAQLSVAGDTARGTAARMRHYARALGEARVVVLHVGTNDLRYRPPEALRPYYDRILAAVPAGVPVVVTDVLPVDEGAFREYGNAQVRAANRVLAQACAARPGCRFAATAAGLTDAGGGLDPRLHVGDGVHLNAAGYRAWLAALAPALAPWRSF